MSLRQNIDIYPAGGGMTMRDEGGMLTGEDLASPNQSQLFKNSEKQPHFHTHVFLEFYVGF